MLHRVGSTYGCRPSSILGITNGWAAYQLDVAALLVGVGEEASIAREAQEQAGMPAKGPRQSVSAGQREYASLGSKARPVRVREDGDWDD